jgi:hypothetical protein
MPQQHDTSKNQKLPTSSTRFVPLKQQKKEEKALLASGLSFLIGTFSNF